MWCSMSYCVVPLTIVSDFTAEGWDDTVLIYKVNGLSEVKRKAYVINKLLTLQSYFFWILKNGR